MQRSSVFLVFIFLSSAVCLKAQDSHVRISVNQMDSIADHLTKKITPYSLKKELFDRSDTLRKSADSLRQVVQYQNKKIDSLSKEFHHRTDSVQHTYAAPLRKLDTEIGRLSHKKDSLIKLKLPTKKIKRQLDSLKRMQAKKLREFNSKINKVKTEMLGKAASLKLPPEVQKEVATFTKNIKGFQLPTDFFKLPSVNVPGMPNITNGSLPNMPSANLPALSLPNVNTSLPSVNLNNLKLPSTLQLEGVVKNDLQQFESIKKKANAETLEKDLENIAQQNSELKSLAKDEQQLKDLKKKLSGANPKNIDSLALQQLKPAVDHFAGKEKELQSAMGTIAKYKQKYSEVKSLSELPKRRPNPLKGKPWQERLVPGLNYFVMSKDNTLVDLNLYVSWRFTPRLTGAIGWNERMGVSKGQVITHRYDRVLGVRTSLSY
ncbi:MAG: hypothetical protein JST48_09470, partial [Bacteroidetes bacterium]|nr:hypothetical protein [Bacteroidota bacterium]